MGKGNLAYCIHTSLLPTHRRGSLASRHMALTEILLLEQLQGQHLMKISWNLAMSRLLWKLPVQVCRDVIRDVSGTLEVNASSHHCIITRLKFCRLLNLIFPLKSHSFGEKKIIFHAHWFLVNSFCISCSFSFKNLELFISAVFKKFFALRCKEFISYCISKNTVYPMQLKIVLFCTFDNKFFIQWKNIIPLFHSPLLLLSWVLPAAA